ncbi:MAG: hypothetical protein K2P93_01540 [Alphaproteobacteria bacterium]|nr:hypothetical protein [Alphaproteobacteria bacterium]
MKRIILFLPFFALLSGCHFSVNNPNHVAAHRSCCLNAGYKIGTREFDKCVQEQEERTVKQAHMNKKDKMRAASNWDEYEKLKAQEQEIDVRQTPRPLPKTVKKKIE